MSDLVLGSLMSAILSAAWPVAAYPDHLVAVAAEGAIRRQQGEAVMDGLGRQQPIEDSAFRAAVGVAMDPGQMLYRQAVLNPGLPREVLIALLAKPAC